MKHLSDLLYWLGHGYTLPEAWNYSRDPRAPQTPAWQVYVALAAAVLAFCGLLAAIAYPYLKDYLK